MKNPVQLGKARWLGQHLAAAEQVLELFAAVVAHGLVVVESAAAGIHLPEQGPDGEVRERDRALVQGQCAVQDRVDVQSRCPPGPLARQAHTGRGVERQGVGSRDGWGAVAGVQLS